MSTTADFLMSNFGATMNEARDFIIAAASVDSAIPSLFSIFQKAGITNSMVAEIVGVQASDVVGFFLSKGIDSTVLDPAETAKTSVYLRDSVYSVNLSVEQGSIFYGSQYQKLDAGNGAYNFILDATKLVNGSPYYEGFTEILNFGADDSITVLGAFQVGAVPGIAGYYDSTGTSVLVAGEYPYMDEFISLVGIFGNPGYSDLIGPNNVSVFNSLPVGDIYVSM